MDYNNWWGKYSYKSNDTSRNFLYKLFVQTDVVSYDWFNQDITWSAGSIFLFYIFIQPIMYFYIGCTKIICSQNITLLNKDID